MAAAAKEGSLESRFGQRGGDYVHNNSILSLALSGGSTPGALYRLLAEEPYRTHIPWSQVHLFWADERCVPHDHEHSKYTIQGSAVIAGEKGPQVKYNAFANLKAMMEKK